MFSKKLFRRLLAIEIRVMIFAERQKILKSTQSCFAPLKQRNTKFELKTAKLKVLQLRVKHRRLASISFICVESICYRDLSNKSCLYAKHNN